MQSAGWSEGTYSSGALEGWREVYGRDERAWGRIDAMGCVNAERVDPLGCHGLFPYPSFQHMQFVAYVKRRLAAASLLRLKSGWMAQCPVALLAGRRVALVAVAPSATLKKLTSKHRAR